MTVQSRHITAIAVLVELHEFVPPSSIDDAARSYICCVSPRSQSFERKCDIISSLTLQQQQQQGSRAKEQHRSVARAAPLSSH
eukprot:615216-Pleurochrysis_carterae.AAC.2